MKATHAEGDQLGKMSVSDSESCGRNPFIVGTITVQS